MSFDEKILSEVYGELGARARRRAERLEVRRQEICAKLPRIGEIDTEIRSEMLGLAAKALQRGEGRAAAERAKSWIASRRAEQRELLAGLGYPPDALELQPECPLCEDRYYVGGRPCRCLIRAYGEAQLRELEQTLPVRTETFDTFDSSVYSSAPDAELGFSPRTNMDDIYDTCRRFAERLDVQEKSLLLCGGPGLGKTFLASAIAASLTAQGRSVLARDAVSFFAIAERSKFSSDADVTDEADAELERIYACDLFLLDGLGNELRSPFISTALYTLLTARIQRGKRLVITTGLEEGQLASRYTPQVASRIKGEFETLYFFGEDVRGSR